jgi:hypothetical protein
VDAFALQEGLTNRCRGNDLDRCTIAPMGKVNPGYPRRFSDCRAAQPRVAEGDCADACLSFLGVAQVAGLGRLLASTTRAEDRRGDAAAILTRKARYWASREITGNWRWADCLLAAVLLGVRFGGLAGVMLCVLVVAVRGVRVMRRRGVVAGFVVLRRLAMMLSGFVMMLGGLLVMICCVRGHGLHLRAGVETWITRVSMAPAHGSVTIGFATSPEMGDGNR